MEQILTKQKEQLKEELCKEIEKYYTELSTGLKDRTIKIDDIERMLGDTQTKIADAMTKSTGESITSTELHSKKNSAHPVAGI